jgi:hypothetical protein
MDIHPQQLESSGYLLKERLEHAQLAPFIQREFKYRTRYVLAYFIANALTLLWLVLAALRSDIGIAKAFSYSSIGLAAAFFLIPLHEWIHMRAYRYVGARQTAMKANWKKMIFLAVADRFVADFREFRIIALAPFVVISLLLLLVFAVAPPAWQYGVAGAYLMHTAACSGDFGLLSYFERHQAEGLVTYDDVPADVSYFYIRQTENTAQT